jgi:hypothetical protein
MLEEAERAASTGDLLSAEELLRSAAQLQEAELGPLHPDLANTLNNLAIITEKEGRPREAETFYRRAVEVASASFPPDDPTVAASRQNLEDFCLAHGLPIEKSAPSVKVSRAPATIAIGIVALVIAFLIARPRSPRQESTTVAVSEPTPARVVAPAPAPPPNGESPLPVQKVDDAPGSETIALETVQLCQSLSTSDWQCVPAGDSMLPGTIVLYTRVRSSHDGVIVHRWYRGDALHMSVQLRIGANAAGGYRTYSRQTVDPGDWRVEVRSAAGELLHEQRFAVRQ